MKAIRLCAVAFVVSTGSDGRRAVGRWPLLHGVDWGITRDDMTAEEIAEDRTGATAAGSKYAIRQAAGDHFEALVVADQFADKTISAASHGVLDPRRSDDGADPCPRSRTVRAAPSFGGKEASMSLRSRSYQSLIDGTRFCCHEGESSDSHVWLLGPLIQVTGPAGRFVRDVRRPGGRRDREGVKAFSTGDDPTTYVAGKFVGGWNIVRDMYARGELEPLVRRDGA